MKKLRDALEGRRPITQKLRGQKLRYCRSQIKMPKFESYEGKSAVVETALAVIKLVSMPLGTTFVW